MARGLTQDDVASLSRAIAEDLRKVIDGAVIKPAPLSEDELRAEYEKYLRALGIRPDEDGMVEVRRTELTPVGLRREAIKCAGQMARDQIEFTGGYTADELVQSARTIETYLSGGFIPSELPTSEKEDQS